MTEIFNGQKGNETKIMEIVEVYKTVVIWKANKVVNMCVIEPLSPPYSASLSQVGYL